MRQEERVAVSRSKIIEAAIEVFGTKGYKEASTNEICGLCGISKGLVFYHYKSKEKLFEECVAQCINEFDFYIKENYIKSGTPMEEIKKCCLLRKKFFSDNPHYHRIFCEVLYEKGQFKYEKYKKLLEIYERHSYDIIEKILDGVKLNSQISREKSIRLAVILIESIDSEIWNQYHRAEETELMLEEQMRQYEDFLEVLFYGILDE